MGETIPMIGVEERPTLTEISFEAAADDAATIESPFDAAAAEEERSILAAESFRFATASTACLAALEMAVEKEEMELHSDLISSLTSPEVEDDVEVSMTRPSLLESSTFSLPPLLLLSRFRRCFLEDTPRSLLSLLLLLL